MKRKPPPAPAVEAQEVVVKKAKISMVWIVPIVVLGLGATIVSGAYININPGTGKPKRVFKGLEVPPVLKLGSDARQYILHAEELGSVTVGSPIIYRGFQVGEVLSYRMMDDDKAVEIKFFVRDPHHKLVFTESKFWDVRGLDIQAPAENVDVKVASITSLMTGGIVFENSKRVTRRVPA